MNDKLHGDHNRKKARVFRQTRTAKSTTTERRPRGQLPVSKMMLSTGTTMSPKNSSMLYIFEGNDLHWLLPESIFFENKEKYKRDTKFLIFIYLTVFLVKNKNIYSRCICCVYYIKIMITVRIYMYLIQINY